MRIVKWGIVISIAGTLAACTTGDYRRESGNFTDETATRANQNASCNAQIRVGNWASFSTVYYLSVKRRITNYFNETVTTYFERGGVGKFMIGFDPDPATDFKTRNVCNRWGDQYALSFIFEDCGKGRDDRPYHFDKANMADGEVGAYLNIEETREDGKPHRNKHLSFVFSEPGLREKLKSSLRTYEKSYVASGATIIFEFEGSKPFVVKNTSLDIGPDWDPPWLARWKLTTEGYDGARAQEKFDQYVYYLFIVPHRSPILNVTILKYKTNEVLFRGNTDFRGARETFEKGYKAYRRLLDNECGKG